MVATYILFISLARTSNYGLKMLKVKGPKMWNINPFETRNLFIISILIKLLKSYVNQ